MKYLLLFTAHRQLEEFTFQNILIGRFVYKPDIMIYSNHPDLKEENYLKRIPNISQYVKKIYCDEENTGYAKGLFTGLDKMYEYYKDYDYVIHLHPDIFILDETKIYNIIKNCDTDFIVMDIDSGIPFTDYFIFKPKKNYFINYKNIKQNTSELILYEMIKDCSKTYTTRWLHYMPSKLEYFSRKTDINDIIHLHNLNDLYKYL